MHYKIQCGINVIFHKIGFLKEVILKKIYIAGPDVFEKDAQQIGIKYKKICIKYGFEGLYPLDNEIKFTHKKETAKVIFESNIKLIQQADIVIANLNNFRGKEPDSGTVWECGYASALGKEVYAYMDDTNTYIDRFKSNEKHLDKELSVIVDTKDRIIEDFDLPINLMLGCSIKNIVQGSFEEVLKSLVSI